MKPILIIVNGLAESGKDAFVNFCTNYIDKTYSYPYIHMHRSDIPKDCLFSIGWDGNKTAEARDLLKRLVDFGEKNGMTEKMVQGAIDEGYMFIFIHVREPESIKALTTRFENQTHLYAIHVIRNIESPEPDYWGVSVYPEYTHHIRNFWGLDELKSNAELTIKNIISQINSHKEA